MEKDKQCSSMDVGSFPVHDIIAVFTKFEPDTFSRVRRASKFINAVAIDCRNHIRVPVERQDIVIGPISAPATKNAGYDPTTGEKRFFGVFIFPHDEDYFDIKPDGVCSSHIHWTTEREAIPFEEVFDTVSGYDFENLEIRWVSTNPWVVYPRHEDLEQLVDKLQKTFTNVRLTEMRLDTIRLLASKTRPLKLKLHNLDKAIQEDVTDIITSHEFAGIESFIMEGSGPFSEFCTNITQVAKFYKEFMYIKVHTGKPDMKPENLDRMEAMIHRFVKDWITGVDMRIKSFFLSNFNLDGILEAFARTDLLEKIRLYLPSGMTGMWASPKGFFNRESIIYHECLIVPKLMGRELMMIGLRPTDLFIRIVSTAIEFVDAIREYYPAVPVDISQLPRDEDREIFAEYLTRLD